MVIRRLIFIAIIAFILNYMWEMLQMSYFENMSILDFKVWLICLRATMGDIAIILFIFSIGRLIFKEWNWTSKVDVLKLTFLILIGASVAILIEVLSLLHERWAYSDLMPVIPKIGVGVVPVIQMIILPFLSYIVGSNLIFKRYILRHKDK
jgi:hypothetical protein